MGIFNPLFLSAGYSYSYSYVYGYVTTKYMELGFLRQQEMYNKLCSHIHTHLMLKYQLSKINLFRIFFADLVVSIFDANWI